MVDIDSAQFAEECLKHHNTLRALHNSPDLVIDIKLNDFAQEWALSIAGKDILEHREENDFGENLYVGHDDNPEWKLEPKVPVQSWYDEISAYKFGEPTPEEVSAVGHFTQVVWKSSEKLGVGIATSETGKIYVVCNYEPKGNINGQYADNVQDIKKDDTESNAQDTKSKAEDAKSKAPDTVSKAQSNVSKQASFQLSIKCPSNKSSRSRSGSRKGKSTIPMSMEDMLAWSSWLTKVTKEMDEWDEWLLCYINLAMRLNKCLKKAQQELGDTEECQESDDVEPCESATNLSKSDAATDVTDIPSAKSPSNAGSKSATSKTVTISPSKSHASKTVTVVASKSASEISSKSQEELTTKSVCSKTPSCITLPSTVSSAATKPDDVTPCSGKKIIPIPKDEGEMLEIVKEFRHQAKRYQLLYGYWLECADKVLQELESKSSSNVSRQGSSSTIKTISGVKMICKPKSSSSISSAQKAPFHYLRECKDINVGFDERDIEVQRVPDGRERIVSGKYQLVFDIPNECAPEEDTKSVKSKSSLKSVKSKSSLKSCKSKASAKVNVCEMQN